MSFDSQHIIWNDRSGSASANVALREELTHDSGWTVHRPDDAEACRELLRELIEDDADLLVAAGGDGTVNDVACAVFGAGSNAVMGVIPLGTGNDFCRNAGIPLNPQQAMELIRTGHSNPIDVALVTTESGTTPFVNMATGGNTGHYINLITDEMKQFWGPFVYLRGAVDLLASLETFRLTLTLDESTPETFQALNVFIANGRCSGGGMTVAPNARLNDGLLDVIVVLDCSPVDIAALATQYAVADFLQNENIVYRQARSLRIESSPQMVFSADGDIVPGIATGFEVRPRALSVITGYR